MGRGLGMGANRQEGTVGKRSALGGGGGDYKFSKRASCGVTLHLV